MLHIYGSVSSVFIHMLQVFSSGDFNVCNGYTCFQVFSGVLEVFQTYVAGVSTILDVCCKCFFLNVAKVDQMLHILNGTHLPQPLGLQVSNSRVWQFTFRFMDHLCFAKHLQLFVVYIQLIRRKVFQSINACIVFERECTKLSNFEFVGTSLSMNMLYLYLS